MKPLELIGIGKPVKLADDIEATVTGIMIEPGNHVQYRCSWWNARARVSEWLEACEVTLVAGHDKMAIGFGGNGHAPTTMANRIRNREQETHNG